VWKKETEKLTPPFSSPAPSVAVPVFFLGGIVLDDGVGFVGWSCVETSRNKSRQVETKVCWKCECVEGWWRGREKKRDGESGRYILVSVSREAGLEKW
jgi:hypothetical protein